MVSHKLIIKVKTTILTNYNNDVRKNEYRESYVFVLTGFPYMGHLNDLVSSISRS